MRSSRLVTSCAESSTGAVTMNVVLTCKTSHCIELCNQKSTVSSSDTLAVPLALCQCHGDVVCLCVCVCVYACTRLHVVDCLKYFIVSVVFLLLFAS